ncbi:hypothetical protein [Mycolicibacterium pulveris]|uniref:hypothetical protein n=1 Tax=Mycolicibacterium pulveris TaxID=36813 RepID=UPI003CF66A8B
MLAGLVAIVAIAVPTDIIDTPLFSRDIPVRWWEYPVLITTGVLTAAWFAIGGARRNGGPMVSGLALVTFAVGCPVCNKLVLLAVGASGALSLWAPLQPVLAAFSLVLLTVLVVLRWRRRPCGSDSCAAALRNPRTTRGFGADGVSSREVRRSG